MSDLWYCKWSAVGDFQDEARRTSMDEEFSQVESREEIIRAPSRCPVNHDAKSSADVLGSGSAREFN